MEIPKDEDLMAILLCIGSMGNVYPRHEEFMTKISEFDATGLASALKRLGFMTQTEVYLFWRKQT